MSKYEIKHEHLVYFHIRNWYYVPFMGISPFFRLLVYLDSGHSVDLENDTKMSRK